MSELKGSHVPRSFLSIFSQAEYNAKYPHPWSLLSPNPPVELRWRLTAQCLCSRSASSGIRSLDWAFPPRCGRVSVGNRPNRSRETQESALCMYVTDENCGGSIAWHKHCTHSQRRRFLAKIIGDLPLLLNGH
ncbi:hypothetical protein Y032_0990g3317 [Ancylostoma ceylanicum]|uniref:Uncharacterized protein n=1 Tax=Ancylostoma ceylanicum TaxID=53326 RepID=A0A016W811_9BILA|nr:hypothetical protein Y032_0990g3317 [Ancylostoma ceylanicum]